MIDLCAGDSDILFSHERKEINLLSIIHDDVCSGG